MTLDQALIAVLALGSGVSVGWVLHAYFTRVHPEGVKTLAKSIGEQLAITREDAKAEIARITEAVARERQEWRGLIGWYQQRDQQIVGQLGQRAARPPTQLEPVPIENAPTKANGTTDHAKVRSRLEGIGMESGRASEMATKIVNGEIDELGLDPLMSTVVDDITREETGAQ